jgi:hypothetical protein
VLFYTPKTSKLFSFLSHFHCKRATSNHHPKFIYLPLWISPDRPRTDRICTSWQMSLLSTRSNQTSNSGHTWPIWRRGRSTHAHHFSWRQPKHFEITLLIVNISSGIRPSVCLSTLSARFRLTRRRPRPFSFEEEGAHANGFKLRACSVGFLIADTFG